MRCCVTNCKNDSRHISKTEGITFHVIPTEPALREAWLRALGRVNWEPRERSAVCSQHFLSEDLYETQRGLRKVKAGAIPFVVQNRSDMKSADPVSEKVCRICLAMDVDLLSMKKYKLEDYYELITGLSLSDARLPQRICSVCARRAAAGARLRDQCVRADAILTALLTSEQRLTEQNIKSIDRVSNNLTSPLTVHIVPETEVILINHDDLQLINDLKIKETKTDERPSLHEVNVAETVEVKNEDEDNSFFDEEPNFDDHIETAKVNDVDQTENNYEENDNFIPSDNSSSCDSIPINQLKKAKLKKKKEDKKPTKKVAKVRKKAVKKDPTEPKIDRRRKPFLNEDLNETLFTIIDLTYEEQIAEIEKRQDSSNYKNAVYKCTECYKGFLDEEAYETHMVRHTDACGEYTCKICKTHFKQPHALRKHITAHHTHRFSCNCCVYVTTHRQTARLHERWHKGTKYQCPHCQEEFVRFTTYMGHVRIKHPSDFVCERCGYSFVSAKGIELHKKLKHRLEDQPIPADGPLCALCNVRFVSEEALCRHVQVSLRHAGGDDKEPKEANAPKGQRKPRDKQQRERKERERRDDDKKYPSQIRKAEGPIPCEQCGMQLEDSRAYHGHFRRAHPDKNRTNYPSMKSPCMCEVCGRMFQSYALLKDHTWTHTGEKPFKCELCGKSFRMKQRLVAHRRVHSAQRATYTCAVCLKHFSTHSNRQRHMFIHTGLKPFKCEMCGKCFKHASEKRAHVSYVHLKKPWPKRARAKRQHLGQNDLEDEMRDPPQDTAQPIWPPCDPKLNEITQIIDDKPMYYNIKI